MGRNVRVHRQRERAKHQLTDCVRATVGTNAPDTAKFFISSPLRSESERGEPPRFPHCARSWERFAEGGAHAGCACAPQGAWGGIGAAGMPRGKTIRARAPMARTRTANN